VIVDLVIVTPVLGSVIEDLGDTTVLVIDAKHN
jgi:hypothetical protein